MRTTLRSPNLAPDQEGIAVLIIHPAEQRFARGGLVQAAHKVRNAGRYGDDTLVHMSREEFEQVRKAWGEPTINPKTGLPEYFWAQLAALAVKYVPAILASLGGSKSGSGGSGGGAGSSMLAAPGAGVLPRGPSVPTDEASAQQMISRLPPSLLAKVMALAPQQDGVQMAKGGLTRHANQVRGAGTDGDNMLVHMNKNELDLLRQHWGEPDTNPRTGLPEYSWFSKALKWIAPVAATVLTGGAAAPWLIGGGLASSLLGGSKGSGSSSAATPPSVDTTGFNEHLQPATFNRTVNPTQPTDYYTYGQDSGEHQFFNNNSLNDISADKSPVPPANTPPATPRPVMGGAGWWGRVPRRTFGIGGLATSGGQMQQGPMGRPQMAMPYPTRMPMRPPMGVGPSHMLPPMGVGPSHMLPGRSMPPQGALGQIARPAQPWSMRPGMASMGRPAMASGGHVSGPGTGRSDDIPARLSDGEYVMDAETVSLLGDGSAAAGAKKLDQMRQRLRSHKGKALARGKFSPAARAPERYLSGGG